MSTGQMGHKPGGVPPKFFMFVGFFFPQNPPKLFFTLRVIFILQGYFWRPSENTLLNKHTIDISKVVCALQAFFCFAREKENQLE